MNKNIFTIIALLFSMVGAYAQTQTCPTGSTLVCTTNISYVYDNVGNRIARSQYCYCGAGGTGRYANPNTKDSLSTQSLTATTDVATISNIYPNPTTTQVTIEFTTAVETAVLTVSNQVGQQVASFKVSGKQTTIDLGDQAAGIYLLTLLQNEQIIATKRVVKIER
jgi:Secretion system C-terminal sorting domain